ncbi:Maf family protein, partial [Xanthomonas perforans]|uniref:Maf family protein n=1 Tax=Xanthomonas perforans TaxID=442694 RepID=UPI001F3FDA51
MGTHEISLSVWRACWQLDEYVVSRARQRRRQRCVRSPGKRASAGNRYAGRMLYLASRSPRRQELLQRLDVPFQTLQLDVPELRAADESPDQYVQRVALEKAHAGLALVQAADPDAIVLGSDTEVVLGERVFGKPVDVDDAVAMLRA